jgi:hypothetical protein
MTTLSTGASPASEALEPNAVDPVVTDVAVDTATDANAAEPSTADIEDAKPLSLLDVVTNAVAPPKEPEASSALEADQEVVTPEAEAEAPKAEDDANLPFHNHPRWQALLTERDSLKEPAAQYQQITGFMREHGLTAEEVAEGFDVMAQLKKGDAESLTQTYAWFKSRTDFLAESIGLTLPADLQAKVDEGLVDEDTATEAAQARAAKALNEQASTRTAAVSEAERSANEARERGAAMATAVQAWENGIKASDPDYAKKASLVETTARAIVQREGKAPSNTEEAIDLVNRAHAEVTAALKAVAPKPKPVAATPASVSANATVAPKTLAEAIQRSIAA